MISHHEAELRRREAEYYAAKFAAMEFANVTEATARLALTDQANTRQTPAGEPLIIQDSMGNLAYQVGLDAPVTPGS
jgi:hypothetical protein